MAQAVTAFESQLMNMLRGIAIMGIVIHHWILFIPHQSGTAPFYTVAEGIESLAGTMVHLFFVLSGCGLTLSFLIKGILSWRIWAKRRFWKIVFPYWIIIFFVFALANLDHLSFPIGAENEYSWFSLFTYLTFARNFYSPGWGLNPTLWFMPVIIGLYMVFPLLIKVMRRHGIVYLLILSGIITYGSITIFVVLGFTVHHQAAWFMFYILEFAVGVLIGHMMYFEPQSLRRLASLRMFFLGILLYAISTIIVHTWRFGSAYNDIFTCMGVFFVALYLCRLLVHWAPERSVRVLNQVSRKSYVMYLIHGPIILFVIRPVLQNLDALPLNSVVTLVMSVLYCGLIFLLAKFISPGIEAVVLLLKGISSVRGIKVKG